jgi:hypothetical protein
VFFACEDVVEVGEVAVDRVEVGVAAPVDGQLASGERRDVAEVGVPYARAVGLDAEQLGPCDG